MLSTRYRIPLPLDQVRQPFLFVLYFFSAVNFLTTIGSGDFIFNLCSHYWNGNDVIILDETNRKKIVDFSHRNSITGSCVACSFRLVTSDDAKQASEIVVVDEER